MLVDKPSEQAQLQNRIVTPPSESMYLMADLRRMDGYGLFVQCIHLKRIFLHMNHLQ